MSLAHKYDEKARTDDVISGESVDFAGLLLSEAVLHGLKNAGFERPSPIQLKAIPLGRCGLDLIVQAKSGTGKTCVFSVIALESIQVKAVSTQVLVLAPTREIAIQIWEVIGSIGSAMQGLKCHTFIGGLPLHEDRKKLQKCHIAIGTPGRIQNLLETGCLKSESIRMFILDEADKLLEDSFQETINWIYSALPENKQMLALSATYPEYLAEHLTKYMRNPTFIRLNVSDPTLLGIKQYYTSVTNHPLPHKVFQAKTAAVVQLLSSVSFHQCLVFSNMQSRAQNLESELTSRGWPTTCIAGCLEQKDRITAMAKLKTYKCRVLISTDLTSRGIDADKVNLVINLDVPKDHETYLHRIGRAGRFGSYGAAVSIVSEGQELLDMQNIERKISTHILPLPDPIPSDLVKRQLSVNLDDVVSTERLITRDGDSQPVLTPAVREKGEAAVATDKTVVSVERQLTINSAEQKVTYTCLNDGQHDIDVVQKKDVLDSGRNAELEKDSASYSCQKDSGVTREGTEGQATRECPEGSASHSTNAGFSLDGQKENLILSSEQGRADAVLGQNGPRVSCMESKQEMHGLLATTVNPLSLTAPSTQLRGGCCEAERVNPSGPSAPSTHVSGGHSEARGANADTGKESDAESSSDGLSDAVQLTDVTVEVCGSSDALHQSELSGQVPPSVNSGALKDAQNGQNALAEGGAQKGGSIEADISEQTKPQKTAARKARSRAVGNMWAQMLTGNNSQPQTDRRSGEKHQNVPKTETAIDDCAMQKSNSVTPCMVSEAVSDGDTKEKSSNNITFSVKSNTVHDGGFGRKTQTQSKSRATCVGDAWSAMLTGDTDGKGISSKSGVSPVGEGASVTTKLPASTSEKGLEKEEIVTSSSNSNKTVADSNQVKCSKIAAENAHTKPKDRAVSETKGNSAANMWSQILTDRAQPSTVDPANNEDFLPKESSKANKAHAFKKQNSRGGKERRKKDLSFEDELALYVAQRKQIQENQSDENENDEGKPPVEAKCIKERPKARARRRFGNAEKSEIALTKVSPSKVKLPSTQSENSLSEGEQSSTHPKTAPCKGDLASEQSVISCSVEKQPSNQSEISPPKGRQPTKQSETKSLSAQAEISLSNGRLPSTEGSLPLKSEIAVRGKAAPPLKGSLPLAGGTLVKGKASQSTEGSYPPGSQNSVGEKASPSFETDLYPSNSEGKSRTSDLYSVKDANEDAGDKMSISARVWGAGTAARDENLSERPIVENSRDGEGRNTKMTEKGVDACLPPHDECHTQTVEEGTQDLHSVTRDLQGVTHDLQIVNGAEFSFDPFCHTTPVVQLRGRRCVAERFTSVPASEALPSFSISCSLRDTHSTRPVSYTALLEEFQEFQKPGSEPAVLQPMDMVKKIYRVSQAASEEPIHRQLANFLDCFHRQVNSVGPKLASTELSGGRYGAYRVEENLEMQEKTDQQDDVFDKSDGQVDHKSPAESEYANSLGAYSCRQNGAGEEKHTAMDTKNQSVHTKHQTGQIEHSLLQSGLQNSDSTSASHPENPSQLVMEGTAVLQAGIETQTISERTTEVSGSQELKGKASQEPRVWKKGRRHHPMSVSSFLTRSLLETSTGPSLNGENPVNNLSTRLHSTQLSGGQCGVQRVNDTEQQLKGKEEVDLPGKGKEEADLPGESLWQSDISQDQQSEMPSVKGKPSGGRRSSDSAPSTSGAYVAHTSFVSTHSAHMSASSASADSAYLADTSSSPAARRALENTLSRPKWEPKAVEPKTLHCSDSFTSDSSSSSSSSLESDDEDLSPKEAADIQNPVFFKNYYAVESGLKTQNKKKKSVPLRKKRESTGQISHPRVSSSHDSHLKPPAEDNAVSCQYPYSWPWAAWYQNNYRPYQSARQQAPSVPPEKSHHFSNPYWSPFTYPYLGQSQPPLYHPAYGPYPFAPSYSGWPAPPWFHWQQGQIPRNQQGYPSCWYYPGHRNQAEQKKRQPSQTASAATLGARYDSMRQYVQSMASFYKEMAGSRD